MTYEDLQAEFTTLSGKSADKAKSAAGFIANLHRRYSREDVYVIGADVMRRLDGVDQRDQISAAAAIDETRKAVKDGKLKLSDGDPVEYDFLDTQGVTALIVANFRRRAARTLNITPRKSWTWS